MLGRISVPSERLVPTQRNARAHYQRILELARSIARYGLLQNLVVEELPDGSGYEVKAGERRRRAIEILCLSPELQTEKYGELIGDWQGDVPVFVIPSDGEAINLIENILRENLHPWEIGRRLAEWNDAGYDQRWISAQLNKSHGWVYQHLVMGRQLSPKVTEAVERMGSSDAVSQRQLLQIAIHYDTINLEPLHDKQVEAFETLLGAPRKKPERREPKASVRMYERAKKLRKLKVPGHAKPYVRALLEYLFSDKQVVRPNFTWD